MRIAVVLSVVLSASPLLAAGWSGFGGTAARDHHTDETLATSLHLAWSRQARHAPRPAWPRDERMSFDRVNRVAVADGRVFYGSSVDGRIRCLDAETGEALWSFATGGPVRFAPALWRDRLFVTSDDGYLYCLAVADGRLLQRWRGGPTDQRVMGNGHVISRWPARGGVVVAGDIVYWAAGIWQSEGIFIRAQQAQSGKLVWLNDKSGGIVMAQPHGGATAKSGVTAQGHLVVTGDRLLVPTGRAVPAVFDSATGQFLYYRLQQNTHRGATATMGHARVFINGGLAYDLGSGGLLKGLGAGSVASAGKTLWRGTGSTLENWELTERTGKDRKGKPVSIRELKRLASIADVVGGGEQTPELDVIFPIIHGTRGEDGTLQGMLELAGIPYVGARVLGSAVQMDKDVAKRLLAAAGLPVVPWQTLRNHDLMPTERMAAAQPAVDRLGFPLFVKPANSGSSVGTSKVAGPDELDAALAEAGRYDTKVLIEQAIDAREIEVAVLGNEDPRASVPGEILQRNEFYDYAAKYADDETELLVPAPLDDATTERIGSLALAAYSVLEGEGFARVDFLLDRESGDLYINELNSLPGFTEASMFPLMWEASGLPYPALLDRLLELALERHDKRSRLETTYRRG